MTRGARRTVIYVIGAETGPVKIGIAVSSIARLRGLQTGNFRKLEIIAESWGNKDDEQWVHSFFAKDRLQGEWFVRTPEMQRFYDLLQQRIPLKDALCMIDLHRAINTKPIYHGQENEILNELAEDLKAEGLPGAKVEILPNGNIGISFEKSVPG
jgi:hypothetical protein